MATDAQDRHDQVDTERVVAMRALLAEPGGEAEIVKRYGEQALNSPELETARAQQKAVTARQREQREQMARQQQARAEQQARQQAQQQGRPGQKDGQNQQQRSPQELKETLRQGRQEVNAAGKEAAKMREQDREVSRSR